MQKTRKFILLIIYLSLLLIILLSFPMSADYDGLVGWWKFDEGQGGVCKDDSGKGNNGNIHGKPVWDQGILGKALKFSGADDYIDCGIGESLNIKNKVSLEIWIKPASIPVSSEPLIAGKGVGTYGITCYKDGVGSLGSRLYFYISGVDVASPYLLDKWQYVVGTYDGETITLYINGKLAASKSAPGKQIDKGGVFFIGKGGLDGIIDDLHVYNRALSSWEILDTYKASTGSRDVSEINLSPKISFSLGNLAVEIDPRAVRAELSKGRSVEIALVPVSGGSASQSQVIKQMPDSGLLILHFPIINLQPGDYEVRVAAKDNNFKDADKVFNSSFIVPTLSWIGNRKGITDKVLPPWTSIKVVKKQNGIDVKVWSRTYKFGTQGTFIDEIVNQGKNMLSKPMKVLARIDDKETEWGNCNTRIVEAKSNKVVISRNAISKDKRIEFKAIVTIDYDGMMRFDWNIKPLDSVKLDDLIFEMSIPGEYAKYWYYPYNEDIRRTGKSKKIGLLPASNMNMAFFPYLWFGDEEKGLQWFCESDKNWSNSDPEQAIQIIKESSNTILRINLISKPEYMNSKDQKSIASYTFGLMATPVKPIEKDGWDLRVVDLPKYGKEYSMLTEKHENKPELDYYLDMFKGMGVRNLLFFNWTDILCYISPVGHSDDFHKVIKASHEVGMQVIVYLGSQMSESAPEWPYIGNRIQVLPEIRGMDSYAGSLPQHVDSVCNNSIYQDFIAYGIDRLIEEYDIDGVYLDGMGGPVFCDNKSHGCGYIKADSKYNGTYPIFATRDMLHRIYTIIKTRKPNGIVYLHQSGQILTPVSSWSDLYLDGEQLRKGNQFVTDSLPLDMFRCEFMGQQLGIPADFLEYTLDCGYMNSMAITLLHNVLPGTYSSIDVLKLKSKIWNVGEDFGRKQAEWLPYWNNHKYITIDYEGIYASLYKHPKNGVLAVISNLTPGEVSAKIKLNLSELGLGQNPIATDALTGTTLPIHKEEISISLKSLAWVILWIK